MNISAYADGLGQCCSSGIRGPLPFHGWIHACLQILVGIIL